MMTLGHWASLIVFSNHKTHRITKKNNKRVTWCYFIIASTAQRRTYCQVSRAGQITLQIISAEGIHTSFLDSLWCKIPLHCTFAKAKTRQRSQSACKDIFMQDLRTRMRLPRSQNGIHTIQSLQNIAQLIGVNIPNELIGVLHTLHRLSLKLDLEQAQWWHTLGMGQKSVGPGAELLISLPAQASGVPLILIVPESGIAERPSNDELQNQRRHHSCDLQ